MKLLIIVFVLNIFTVENLMSQSITGKISGYDLAKPDNYWTLQDQLNEISGLAPADGSFFACVQDEKGVVFIYDPVKKRIKDKIVFGDDGDFEDIAIAANSIFVLRSDGTIFKLAIISAGSSGAEAIKTGIPAGDNEGLCYDPVSGKLLIACKGDIKIEDLKNKRPVFAFDLKTKTLGKKPFLIIDPEKIESYLKKSISYDDYDINFRISAIAVHPVTKKIFAVSADDNLICVFNRDGTLENVEILGKKLFNKTEGIAFLQNGDLLLSNEGEKREGDDIKASILKFKYNANR